MKIEPEFCQVQGALSILTGKWKPIILLYLMSEGTMRYGELKKALVDINLKCDDSIKRFREGRIDPPKIYPEVPPKVEYSITEYGMTLKPILETMHEWGISHIAKKSIIDQT